MNSTLKIALSGQVERDTRIAYTYPEPFDPMASAASTPRWLRSIFDPRDARNFNTDKVYAFWTGPEGNYYGMIVPSPNDTRNGRLMITIFAGKNIIRSGEELAAVFDTLQSLLIERDPATVDRMVIEQLLSRLTLTPQPHPAKSNPSGPIGYRDYASNAELFTQLANCDQTYYSTYRRVLFVSTLALPPLQTIGLAKISDPVVVKYFVRTPFPQGMHAEPMAVNAGGMITIFFDKEGFTSKTERVVVDGKPNPYFDYEGNAIVLREVQPASESFSRCVRLLVVDAYDKRVNGIRIRTNGNHCNVKGDVIEFLNPAESYDITVIASDGTSVPVHISARELADGEKTVRMNLKSQPDTPVGAALAAEKTATGRIVAYCAGGVVGLYLLYAAVCGMASGAAWPFHSTNQQQTSEQTEQTTEVQKDDRQGALADSNMATEDVNYMKMNDTWSFAAIKSSKYKQLTEAIANGNIDAILSTDWFPNDTGNGYWKQIVERLHTMTPEQQIKAKDAMINQSSNGDVALSALNQSLISIATPSVEPVTPRPEAPVAPPAPRPKANPRPAPAPQKRTEPKANKDNQAGNLTKSKTSTKEVAPTKTKNGSRLRTSD